MNIENYLCQTLIFYETRRLRECYQMALFLLFHAPQGKRRTVSITKRTFLPGRLIGYYRLHWLCYRIRT